MKNWTQVSTLTFALLLFGLFPLMEIFAQTPNVINEEEILLEDVDALDEFDELDEEIDEAMLVPQENDEPSYFNYFRENAKFSLGHQLGYAFHGDGHPYSEKTDGRPVVTNRSSLRLEWDSNLIERVLFHFDGKMTMNYSNDHLTKAQDDSLEYHSTQNIRETYLQTSLDSWSVKLGKQIVIWGESESSVVDEISPRDQTEVFFTALEDSRIGQTMILMNYFSSDQEWSLFYNPDSQTNRLPKKGTEYYSLLPDDNPQIKLKIDEPLPAEVGLRWKRYVGSSDLSIMIADLNDNAPVYELDGFSSDGRIKMTKLYSRYQLYGIGGNLSFGNFLLKGELAYKANRQFQVKNPTRVQPLIKKDSVDGSFDIEYRSNDETTYLVGVSNQHLLEWEDIIDQTEDETIYFVGWSKAFLNETLSFRYNLNYAKQSEDTIHRLKGEYTIIDDLILQVSTVYFDPSTPEKGLGAFKKKSRITTDLTYYF